MISFRWLRKCVEINHKTITKGPFLTNVRNDANRIVARSNSLNSILKICYSLQYFLNFIFSEVVIDTAIMMNWTHFKRLTLHKIGSLSFFVCFCWMNIKGRYIVFTPSQKSNFDVKRMSLWIRRELLNFFSHFTENYKKSAYAKFNLSYIAVSSV